MKFKLLGLILAFAFLLAGCGNKTATTTKPSAGMKVLINELEFSKRPFVAFVPHESNKLFTFFATNADKLKEGVIDIEYQSGELLKGAKVSVNPPVSNPYTKAVILGSCSTGGKCTFDKDLSTGNLKFKMVLPDENVAHILKGDYVFITGVKNLPDGKVSFEPSKANLKNNLIMGNSFGLPKQITDKEIALYPVYISATQDKQIAGNLVLKQSGVKEVLIYNGSEYKTLKAGITTDQVSISLAEKPWSIDTSIIRDDMKSSVENIKLYVVGPIVLIK